MISSHKNEKQDKNRTMEERMLDCKIQTSHNRSRGAKYSYTILSLLGLQQSMDTNL